MQGLHIDASHLRQHLRNARQLGGCVASLRQASGPRLRCLIQPVWRDVGRIGFHHQSVCGYCAGQLAKCGGALVGHGPTKTQSKAHRHKSLGLLRAAIERVGNATCHLHLSQPFEQHVRRAAHMQDDGQAIFLGQQQLRRIKLPLPLTHLGRAQLGDEIIQADFAHGDQARIMACLGQRFIQRIQVIALRLRHIQGVNAQGIRIAMLGGQGLHTRPIAALHCRQHTQTHTRIARGLAHLRTVGRKLRRVQMAVGVDPEHAQTHAQGPGPQASCPRTRCS